MQATFTSNITSAAGTDSTFYVISDNSTIVSLIASIRTNCSSILGSNSSTVPVAFNSGAPERAVQYYRASTVVLALDGYNDTAMLSGGNAQTHTPLPAGVDRALLDCLNYTIGESAPMFSGVGGRGAELPHAVVLLGPLYLLLCLLHVF